MRSPLLVVLPFSTLLGGCFPLACEEVGCFGSYNLSFQSESWADGEYTLSVSFDGLEASVCTFTLPLDGETVCDNLSAVTLEDDVLRVTVATPMDDEIIEADIALSVEGTALLSEVVEPSWGEPYYPNGKACDEGYGCLSAADDFTL